MARGRGDGYRGTMRVHDLFPHYARFLDAAAAAGVHDAPTSETGADSAATLLRLLETHYVQPSRTLLAPLLQDWEHWAGSLAGTLGTLELGRAREAIATAERRGDPGRAEATLAAVERKFGRKLEGELVLMAGFGRADGYARFEHGTHCVYIGLDYPEPADHYLDLIIAHELGHVVREGDPRTWAALGLPASMAHETFQESCPFEEHMIGEGLSTALSNAIYPGHERHELLFFTPAQLAWCEAHDEVIGSAIRRFYGTAEEHYRLYAPDAVAPGSPERTQYYAGYRAIESLVQRGHDLNALFETPARRILELAGKR
jgi:hypothetical protein